MSKDNISQEERAEIVRTLTEFNRHPSTIHLAKQFNYRHLPPFLQAISHPFYDMAMSMITSMEDSPELTAGLRKLLEAKDCFVRARIDSDPVVYHDR